LSIPSGGKSPLSCARLFSDRGMIMKIKSIAAAPAFKPSIFIFLKSIIIRVG
jgi:hypothetical protein